MKTMILTDDVIHTAVTIIEAAEKMAAENGISVAQAAKMMLKTMQFAQSIQSLNAESTEGATVQ